MAKPSKKKKKVVAVVKLQIPAGEATPQPPVGPALAQYIGNIMDFCKQFNAATQKMKGYKIPVVVTIYQDKKFTFITKQPPVADLLKKAAGVEKGSGMPNRNKVGKVTMEQVREIARQKMQDMVVNDEDAAVRSVMGTARSMGIEVVEA